MTGIGMTNQQIMLAFFRGQQLANNPATVAALRWYGQIALNKLADYSVRGYVGVGIANQCHRLVLIMQQFETWGL